VKEKYLSIITNFGCHYACPYCIVKNNNIDVPKTTIEGLGSLKKAIYENDINIVSISGGGDPLYEFHKNYMWYQELVKILFELQIPFEMHTSYINSSFPVWLCKRVVYHLSCKKQLATIRKYANEIVRAVFVVTDDMTENDIFEIAEYVKKSNQIDELSFRQRVDKNYKVTYHLHDILKSGHKKDWWYIEQCDYNLYYAENKVYEKYSDFKSEVTEE
jgi:organic radical activating enzyme